MSEIKLFENPSFGSVRVIMRENDPWFVARDVATCLGYSNTNKAILDHCKKAETLGNIRGNETLPLENTGLSTLPVLDNLTKIVPESDLYRLIMRSKLPAAEAFQDWVVEEVLPSIRKTGMYMPNFNDPLEAAKAWVASEEKRRAAELEARAAQKALSQKTGALNELLNHWGEGETFHSCIAERENLVKYFDIKYKTDAGDNVYKQCGKLLTQLCTGGMKISDPRFKGHTFEMKRESHPSSVFGGWNVYHVEAWQYFYEVIEKDGAASLPYLGKYAR